MRRDTRIFRTGVVVLVLLLPFVVFLPLSSSTGDAAAFSFLPMVLVASWFAWFATQAPRTAHKGEAHVALPTGSYVVRGGGEQRVSAPRSLTHALRMATSAIRPSSVPALRKSPQSVTCGS